MCDWQYKSEPAAEDPTAKDQYGASAESEQGQVALGKVNAVLDEDDYEDEGTD